MMTDAPAPASAPPDPFIVIYDGNCEICRAGMRWLRFLDTRREMRPMARKDPELLHYHPALHPEETLTRMQVLTPQKNLLGGWQAVVKVLSLMPLTGWLGWLLGRPAFRLPGERLYALIAANRYAMGHCNAEACEITAQSAPHRKNWFLQALGWLICNSVKLIPNKNAH